MQYRNRSVSRRRLLQAGSATLLGMAIPRMVLAGTQREETLSDDVASIMRNAVNNANPPRLIFSSPAEASRWLNAMSGRLASVSYTHLTLPTKA